MIRVHAAAVKFFLSCLVALTCLPGLSPRARAVDGTYINSTSGGGWSDPGNWLNGNIADGADAVANFSTLDLAANNTVTFDLPRTIGYLNFADTTPNFNWIIAGGNTLSLQTSLANTTPTINVINQTATMQAQVAGNQGFVKSGAGTLVLSTNISAWTGNAVINGGTLFLQVGQDATAGFILNGGTLQTSQALVATNVINARSGSSALALSNNGNTAGLGTFNGVLAGNGNVTLTNFTASLNTVSSQLLANYGGALTWGSSFGMRGLANTGGTSTWNSPFATVDFGGSNGSIFARGAGTGIFILGGLKSTSFGAAIGATSFGGTQNIIAGSANTDTLFQGQLAAGGGTNPNLTKSGTGTMTLAPNAAYSSTGTISVNGGTLRADYLNSAGAVFNAASNLTIGGGTLHLRGRSTGATAQTMGNVTVNVGGGTLVLDPNGGTSTTLTLGTLTATANGGALNIRALAPNATVTTTSPLPADGAYGGRITNTDSTGATNWATTTSGAAPFVLSGYSAYSPFTGSGADSATANYALAGSNTLTSADSVNSLKMSTTGAGQALDLGGNFLSITNGGLLFTGANDYEIKNGSIVSNTVGNSDLIVHQHGAGTLTVSAVVANSSGVSTLTKAGPGTLTLTGANTYTGQTFLNAGTLSVGSNANLSDAATGAAVALNGGTLQATASFTLDNGGSSARGIILYGSGGAIEVTGSNNLTVPGVISNINLNNQGPLIKTGPGTLTLTGTNTYTGATRLVGGVLSVSALTDGGVASNIGASVAAAPALIFDGGTLQYTGLAQSTNRTFTLTPGGGTIDASGSGPLTFSNVAPVVTDSAGAGSGARALTLTGSAAGNVFAGQIVNGTGGATTLNKTGPGSWTLINSNHTYTGNTNVTGGTLLLSAAANNNIAASNTIRVTSGAILDTTGLTSGALVLGSGQTLTGNGNVNGGVVTTAGSNLTPGNNGVGTLSISALTLSPGAVYNYEFNASANDLINVLNPGALTLNGGGFNLFAEGTANKWTTPGHYRILQYNGALGGAGIGSLSASAILNPQAGLTYGFDTTTNPGFVTLNINGASLLVAKWAFDASGNWGDGTKWTTNPNFPRLAGETANFATALSAARTVTLDGGKTVGVIEFNSPAFGYTIAPGSGALILDNLTAPATVTDTAGSHTIAVPLSLSSDTTVSVANAGDTLTLSGNIGNTGAAKTLSKTGPGTLVLSGNNSYGPAAGSSGTVINGGTLQVGSNNALGAGDVSFTGNSTLSSGAAPALALPNNFVIASGVNATVDNTLTLSGIISESSPSGQLTKTGAGLLKLTNNNTYTGATTVSAGTLQLGDGGTTGSVAGPIVNNAALVFNRSDNVIVVNSISGAGSLTQAGGGDLALAAANTFSGDTTIAAGTLTVVNPQALQNSTLNYNNQGGTIVFVSGVTAATLGGLKGAQDLALVNADNSGVALDVGNNGQSTAYSGVLSGAGSIRKVGGGTLTLSGAQIYTGNTTVSGGVLSVTTGGSISGGGIFTSGGRFQVGGGTVTPGALSTIGFNGFVLDAGVATFNAGISSDQNDGGLIAVNGGTFSASDVRLQRTANFNTVAPTLTGIAGSTTSGFYVNGGTATVGTLRIGTLNSSASARVDSGSLTATGRVTVGQTTNTRYSILQVNGGAFIASDAADGVVLSAANGATANNSEFLVTGGTATVEKISFGVATDTVGGNGFVIVNSANANLYVGAGGIVKPNQATVPDPNDPNNVIPAYTATVYLTNGTLGANADWTSPLPMQLPGTSFTIKAADAANAPHNITLDGVLSGPGALVKSGGGTLTLTGANTYAGATAVTAGTLVLGTAAQEPIFGGPNVTTPAYADVRGGRIAFKYAGDPSTLVASVLGALDAGYGQTPQFSAGAIRSTTLAAGRALGWMNNTTDSQVEVAYTLPGDANLDFAVNFNDLVALAQHYNTTDGSQIWATGDFNYDGNVDFNDLVQLAQNYNTALPAAPIPGAPSGFEADLAAAFASVPEPTSLASMALVVGLLVRRERRACRRSTI